MNARGFTLLEVLVALAILSVAVVASIQGFAQGLRLLKLSGDHQEATLLADQKMREVVVPVEGREEGTETRFQWIRTVAKEGALEALANSRPGVKARQRDWELELARADAARLGEALKEMAVKLMLVEGKGRWG